MRKQGRAYWSGRALVHMGAYRRWVSVRTAASALTQVHSYAELVIRSMNSCLECTPVLV